LILNRHVFDPSIFPAHKAGKYTMAIAGNGGDPASPEGYGYAVVSVTSAGRITSSGRMSDGTKYVQTANLSKNGQWPFYSPFYGGAGSAFGWLHFTNDVIADIRGPIHWIKPPNTAEKCYPDGFSSTNDAVGSTYQQLPPGARPLGFNVGEIDFIGGNLAEDFSCPATFETGGFLRGADAQQLRVAFVPGTGLLKGSVVAPATSAPITFNGVILQKMNGGYGFFLGGVKSGTVTIEAAP
jgi:hypothetical protein